MARTFLTAQYFGDVFSKKGLDWQFVFYKRHFRYGIVFGYFKTKSLKNCNSALQSLDWNTIKNLYYMNIKIRTIPITWKEVLKERLFKEWKRILPDYLQWIITNMQLTMTGNKKKREIKIIQQNINVLII